MTDYRTAPSPSPNPAWTEPTYDQHAEPDQPGVKDRAGESLDQGKQAAGDLAATVGDKAGDVKDVTVKQARDLVDEARSQLGHHAGEQHRNLVTNLRSLSSEMQDMTSAGSNPGVATSLVSQARGHVDTVADWLDRREPDQLVDELRSFARRRPGAFLVGALAAGLVAGRLTRGAIDARSDDSTPDALASDATTNGRPSTYPPTSASPAPAPAPLHAAEDRAPAGQPFDPAPYPQSTYPASPQSTYPAGPEGAANPVPGFGDLAPYPSETGETRELRHEEWQHGGDTPR